MLLRGLEVFIHRNMAQQKCMRQNLYVHFPHTEKDGDYRERCLECVGKNDKSRTAKVTYFLNLEKRHT